MNIINIVTRLAIQGKYLWLFVIYLIEGPWAGFASSVVAATGRLNIYIVFILLVIAEIGADLIYYYIGKEISESKLQKKLSKYEKNKFFQAVKEIFDTHPIKTLTFAKIVGIIAVPTLILLGNYQVLKTKKFILWTTIICLIKDIIIVVSGYSLGVTIETFLLGYSVFRIIGIVLSILAILYVVYKINQKKIEDITIKLIKKI